MKAAFTYSHERKDAKKSGESIGCHSHHDFSHTGVRRVGQQLPGAAAEQKRAWKHNGIQKSWEKSTLGMLGNHLPPARGWADVTTLAYHTLPSSPLLFPSHRLP